MPGERTKPGGSRKRWCLLAAVALSATLAGIAGPSGDVHAQEYRRQQRGLLDFLFGGLRNRQIEPQQRRYIDPVERAPAPSRRTSRPAVTAVPRQPPPPPAVEKLENARSVLVVGDFLAGGLAEGLEAAYAQSPGVRIVNASNGSSGFVREDYYNWNAEIVPLIEEAEPAVVVVMIGSNDRQQMVVDGHREAPRSDAWLAEYDARVERFAKVFQDRGIPIIWSGLPAFKSPSMTSDMLAFNDIYKSTVEAAEGAFVDIWDGFVDENGAFVFTGPDMNGQAVRLRGSDGINLTRAGKRKIAFYVEKPLNKLLGQAVLPDIGEIGIQGLPDPSLGPSDPKAVDRTVPISLTDPVLDGGTELLGAVVKPIGRLTQDAAPEGRAASDRERSGRADDFSLQPEEAGRPESTNPAAP
ncbi:DUF459 domain-containing protein [Nitratireductor sp. ZSWI3]|uniref:SGNH/GDSL hydrolase family protein n=1 Tax=Nitratireductor sp. ZSWI3 TaxID=2966359 RepID=UPI0021504D32|nr:DUF459 domain-containing protein [Nitratireductor sp. ZSWI3]MCR4264969.1 DUF459 domain-containing protein [Nitratireductor sp. ZSWI3]